MRWLLNSISRSAFRPLRLRCRTKSLSTISSALHNSERVSVPVGSSGNVIIDLHNLAKVSSSEPLLVYLPPFSTAAPTSDLAQLPRFAQGHATAVVQYRWTEPSVEETAAEETAAEETAAEDDATDHGESAYRLFRPGWPAPIHDVLTAYTWIVDNLAPTAHERRDIYVYGSYLGASLAASLALTEAYPHQQMAVRGCIAYNGIYDWTVFLPDHAVNDENGSPILDSDPSFQELKRNVGELFNKPSNLFDPFASPCHFFHTGGLLVPHSFNESAISSVRIDLTDPAQLDKLSDEDIWRLMPREHPRKDPLIFPPPNSTLQIPDMLLLYDTAPPLPPTQMRRRLKKNNYETLFEAQAQELASLIQRELKQMRVDEGVPETSDDEEEAVLSEDAKAFIGSRPWGTKWRTDTDLGRVEKQVQIHGVGHKGIDDRAAAWLEDRMIKEIV